MNPRMFLVLGAVALSAVCRTIPPLWNLWAIWPITAMALFGGSTLTDRRLAWTTPLLALFASDVAIEILYRLGAITSWGFYGWMWGTYLSVCVVIGLGFLLRKHRSVPAIAGCTLAASCLHFAFTNFAVWTSGVLYPRTWAGLEECYVAAIPFFKTTLVGDVLFATAFFGGWALLENHIASRHAPVLSSASGGSAANPPEPVLASETES